MAELLWRSRSGSVKNVDDMPDEYLGNIIAMFERGKYKDGADIDSDQTEMFEKLLDAAERRGIIQGEKFGWDR